MAILAEKEAKRLAELKKATYEMSKTWDNTVEVQHLSYIIKIIRLQLYKFI